MEELVLAIALGVHAVNDLPGRWGAGCMCIFTGTAAAVQYSHSV